MARPSIQGVLPKGSPAEVAEHVRQRAATLGEGGGYIFGTAHNILPDTPTENIVALVNAYREYGTYSRGPNAQQRNETRNMR